MLSEEEKRAHRVCFTGHRPEKLNRREKEIKKDLEKEIRQAMSDGLNVFITGMARGVDIWAAEIVLRLRRWGHPVKLICACPYAGVEENWSPDWQRKYRRVLKSADLVRYISAGYSADCFRRRNEWMVRHCARVIAVFGGQPGGTEYTIRYARQSGVTVACIPG